MSGDPPAFLDTNVLVYAFDRGDEAKRTASRRLIERLGAEGRLRLSTQVLQEFFVNVTRKISTPIGVEDAIHILDDLAVWNPVLIDTDDIRRAARLSAEAMLSFWDALIVVAAAHSGASTLYTEDMSHGQEILGVTVVNPFLPDAVHDAAD
ncbi:MAG: PIN domain-containing protein [Deltaproteobacteria bacterium]|nr:PIN domain-containing protein [Deltaproteobacteria bacterium]